MSVLETVVHPVTDRLVDVGWRLRSLRERLACRYPWRATRRR